MAFTNTKFTSKAIDYAKCRGIRLTGWNYPADKSLENLILDKKIYPVTVLPSIGRFSLEQFAKKGLLLAQDLLPYSAQDFSREFGVSAKEAEKISAEAAQLIKIMKLAKEFFEQKTVKVAQRLLGKTLCVRKDGKILRGIIVETEAYRGEDDLALPRLKRPDEKNGNFIQKSGDGLRLSYLRDALLLEYRHGKGKLSVGRFDKRHDGG